MKHLAARLLMAAVMSPAVRAQVDVLDSTSTIIQTTPTISAAVSWVDGQENAGLLSGNVTIRATDGTYQEKVTLQGFSAVNLTVESVNGPNVTKIYWPGGPCVDIRGSALPVTLRGFSVTTNATGRGIYIEDASPTIEECFVSCCSVTNQDGAGIYGFRSTLAATLAPTIRDCAIWGNLVDSGNGGGLAFFMPSADTLVEDCDIAENKAIGCGQQGCGVFHGGGGGVYQELGFMTLRGNTIRHNEAGSDGGGVCIADAQTGKLDKAISAMIDRNRIVGNRVLSGDSRGGGIFVDNPTHRGDMPLVIRCNVIAGNGLPFVDGLQYPGAAQGGGVYIGSFHESFVLNNTIWGNHANADGGGGYINRPEDFDFISDPDEQAHFYNNIFWDNVDVDPTPWVTPDLYYEGATSSPGGVPYVFVKNVSATQSISNPPTVSQQEFGDAQFTVRPDLAADAGQSWILQGGGDYSVFDIHLQDTQVTTGLYAYNGNSAQLLALASAINPPPGVSVPPTADIDGAPIPGTIGGVPGAVPVGADLRTRQMYLWSGLPYDSGTKGLMGVAGFTGDFWLYYYDSAMTALCPSCAFQTIPIPTTGNPQSPGNVISFIFNANSSSQPQFETFFQWAIINAPPVPAAPWAVLSLPNQFDQYNPCGPNR